MGRKGGCRNDSQQRKVIRASLNPTSNLCALRKNSSQETIVSRILIQTGRLGDVINVLPLLHADYHRTGQKSQLMVARDFAPLLDGCSYLDPLVWDGDYMDLEGAVKLARTLSDDVVVTSLHGTAEAVEKYAYGQIGQKHRTASSFQKEAWLLAGRLDEWDDCLPLVFDRRNPEREKKLLGMNGFMAKGKRKPVLLLALEGVTSPFPYASLLRELVQLKFGRDYRILDLPMVEPNVGRIYDLLAVMENSSLLITTDSMPLHLAWACRDLPVFALTNDRDPKGNPSLWHGAPWRPNHLWYCRYHDWPERAVEMIETIARIEPESRGEFVTVFRSDSIENRCTDVYRGSWNLIPVHRGTCSREIDGAPLIKDVIRMAIQRATPFAERADGGPDPDAKINLCREDVTAKVKTGDEPHFAYRIQDGQFSPIADLFSAPKSFWRQILPEIPDGLVLDNEEKFWAEALRIIFEKYGATDATGCCEFVGEEKS